MAAPAVRRSTPTPKAPPPAVTQTNVAKTQSNPLVNTNAGNQAAYRTLAESSKVPVKEPAAVPTSTAPATLAGGGKSKLKLPPLSPRVRQEMVDDIEKIVTIMKDLHVSDDEEHEINEVLAKHSARDRGLRPPLGETLSPNLDHFLILMKSRSFSRSSVKSLGQDQYAILYDAIWYRFDGEGLDEFKNLVARSQTQKTSGPSDKDVENGAALIAKQEAMGMWGMLKGLGTGLVSIAGPTVSQAMAEQFDEAARELFGHEWDNGEPLVWGMNAGQIGTAGGDVIWQLMTFARSAGAKGGKILELATRLKDLTDKAQMVIAVSGGLQGVYLGATGIARIIEEKQKAGIKITAKELMNDGPFVDQLVTLMSSVINTTMAVKGAKVAPLTRRRVQLLLAGAQISASISHLATIAASDKSDIEKELEYGQVVASLIPQLVSAAIDVKGYSDDKKTQRNSQKTKPGDVQTPEKNAAPQKDAPEQDAPPKVAPPKDEQDQAPPLKPQSDEESGELSRKTMSDAAPPPKKTPKFHDESPAGQKLQADLEQEAQHGLAPRQAPATPEEVKSGARKAKYAPVATESTTIKKSIATLDEARATYDDVIAETGGKYEVGVYQTPDGKYAVRLGQVANVDAPTEWRSVQHYHTNEPDIPLWRMPARADMAEPAVRAERTNKPTTEIIEYPLPGGKRGRAAYTVNPDGSMKVEYVDVAGKKQSKPFASVRDYNAYYETSDVFVDPSSKTYRRLMGIEEPPTQTPPGQSSKTMYGPGKEPPDTSQKTPKADADPDTSTKTTEVASPAPGAPPKKPAVAYAGGETREVREPEVVKGRVGGSKPEYQASPKSQTKRPFTDAELDPLGTEIERRREISESIAETDQATLNPKPDKLGVQRGPSVDEAQRALQDQATPSGKAQAKAKVFESHATGLEAKALAEKQGIKFTEWDNPESHKGDFGKGIDAVGERGAKKLIVEYKGETSTLADGQMSNEWVGRKIAQLEILNDPMAATLLDAAGKNNLQGVVYNTKTVDNEAVSTRQDRGDLTKKLPNTNISDAGLIQYSPTKVQAAYQAELARLAAQKNLRRDPTTGKWKSGR